MHKHPLAAGLCPHPLQGSLQRSSRLHGWIYGARDPQEGVGQGGREAEGRERKGNGWEGKEKRGSGSMPALLFPHFKPYD